MADFLEALHEEDYSIAMVKHYHKNISFTCQAPDLVYVGICPSPVGDLTVGMVGDGTVCLVGFPDSKNPKAFIQKWQKLWKQTKFVMGDGGYAVPMRDIFKKADSPILLVGTVFQHKVWRAIAGIPRGQVQSYGAIAHKIRHPKAVRAVGTACGKNPVPLLIPCHRVVGMHGIGGFGGGLPLKQKLLRGEGMIY